jgi:hypothetical protein
MMTNSALTCGTALLQALLARAAFAPVRHQKKLPTRKWNPRKYWMCGYANRGSRGIAGRWHCPDC